MVKFYLSDNTTHGEIELSWASKDNFYTILNKVKNTLSTRKNKRTYVVQPEDFLDVVNNITEVESETVHVDMGIFKKLINSFKKRHSLLKLRGSLDGYDCGVELKKPYNLLPFQHVAVEFMYAINDGIIADKVGLGKTVEGFCTAQKFYDLRVIDKAIVLLPSSLKVKWKRDIEKLLGGNAVILEGNVENRSKVFRKWLNSKDLFLLVSYDTMKRDVLLKVKSKRKSNYEYVLNEDSYFVRNINKSFMLIMDEVQRIRNHNTARAKCCKLLSKMSLCKSRIGLSATYIETGLEDLFGVMSVIDESVFGNSILRFENTFINRDYMGKTVGYNNVGLAESKMKFKAIRRNKEQVKNQLNALLPKVNESTYWIEMSKEQVKLGKEIRDKCIDILRDMERADKINVSNALTQIGYLRQLALSTELINPDIRSSPKLDELLEFLPPIIEDNKVIIFSFYTVFIDIMEREMNKAGIKTYALHGKRKEGQQKNRQLIIDKFSESKDIQVLLTSDILAEGIDVPAASYVINMDTLWNPAKMVQRCGRIDRLNQQSDNIFNVNFWMENSIEQEMYKVIYDRLELSTQIIDGGLREKRFKRLSFEDLKIMLRNLGGKI